MKFATWTHPRTGETRIYINGYSALQKAFISNEDGCPMVKCYGAFPSQIDILSDLVEMELASMNGGVRPVTFEEVLAIVQK